MPERIRANRYFGWLVIGLLVCVLGLTIGGLIASMNLSRTLEAQKTSAARGECRARVVNEDEDDFRHRIGDALRASYDRNQAEVVRILTQIQNAEPTQSRIDRICPAPLVKETP